MERSKTPCDLIRKKGQPNRKELFENLVGFDTSPDITLDPENVARVKKISKRILALENRKLGRMKVPLPHHCMSEFPNISCYPIVDDAKVASWTLSWKPAQKQEIKRPQLTEEDWEWMRARPTTDARLRTLEAVYGIKLSTNSGRTAPHPTLIAPRLTEPEIPIQSSSQDHLSLATIRPPSPPGPLQRTLTGLNSHLPSPSEPSKSIVEPSKASLAESQFGSQLDWDKTDADSMFSSSYHSHLYHTYLPSSICGWIIDTLFTSASAFLKAEKLGRYYKPHWFESYPQSNQQS
ncbi:hypothetical protein CROQUDRAFT_674975 [Cronartium quercuum f. sp. fusiforme G11]|uniref:Uncharacterized protein n=1 Tax=Cronartium quercuum f. sp. fusiforme G11 TaxID=708437 RepID=A0A9P6T6S9_9BASI|nr:hypothetical protein CROQUDRAFT_674975 [Cronartium quercuum f. sp. fusiforme G11]